MSVRVCLCVCICACVAVTVCGSAPGLTEREQISTLAGLELNEELCLRGCCHFQRAPLPIITGHLSSSLAKIKRSLRLNSLRKCWYFWIAFIIRTRCKLPVCHLGPIWDPFLLHFCMFCTLDGDANIDRAPENSIGQSPLFITSCYYWCSVVPCTWWTKPSVHEAVTLGKVTTWKRQTLLCGTTKGRFAHWSILRHTCRKVE